MHLHKSVCLIAAFLQTNYLCTGCGLNCGTLTAENGTFSDGSGSSNYPNNANCEWMIAPYGADSVTITFTAFSTQYTKDVVRVFECQDTSCSQSQQLAELSGTYPDIYTVTSLTGYMRVVFTSDGSINSDGFTASWNTVRLYLQSLQVSNTNVTDNFLCSVGRKLPVYRMWN
jgi:hypothetical protein